VNELNWDADQQSANATRQFVKSFCVSDVAECKRIIQIGERRWLIADPPESARIKPFAIHSHLL
jgi:hypothetical protein